MRKFLLAVALACAPVLAAAASRIVPAEPSAFDLVNLRMEVDSCAFVPSTVHVTMAANTLRVTVGPPLPAPTFDPQSVFYTGYGTATLDFSQAPGREGVARFDYTIQGVMRTKSIQRMGL
jgi:hypothetical protein